MRAEGEGMKDEPRQHLCAVTVWRDLRLYSLGESGVIAVFRFGPSLWCDGARVHELSFRRVAVIRNELPGSDPIQIKWLAKFGRVENPPAGSIPPQEPRVQHPGFGAGFADDETQGLIVHLISDPE